MPKLTLPSQPELKDTNVYENEHDLSKMSIEALYDYQNQINEYTNKDLYWKINREIQKKRINIERDLINELKELRSAVNLLKLAVNDLALEK